MYTNSAPWRTGFVSPAFAYSPPVPQEPAGQAERARWSRGAPHGWVTNGVCLEAGQQESHIPSPVMQFLQV